MSQLRTFTGYPTFVLVQSDIDSAPDAPTTGFALADAGADASPLHAVPVSRALVLRLGGAFTIVVLASALDLALDRPSSWTSAHVLVELTILIVSLAAAIALWRTLRRTSQELSTAHGHVRATRAALALRQAERDAWRLRAEAALNEFAVVVDEQMAVWRLTSTERDVALLILQGLGHRDVALRLGRSERTVRQHAVAVYVKAGVGSRAELAAFFLRDALPVRRHLPEFDPP